MPSRHSEDHLMREHACGLLRSMSYPVLGGYLQLLSLTRLDEWFVINHETVVPLLCYA